MSTVKPPPEVTAQVFAEWRDARRGRGQAELMTNPFWSWMVETGFGPYRVNEHFGGPPSSEAGPGWTNQRYGQSSTELPDGRTVMIAGEHEDYYDPDFYIYNDVIVRDPNGGIEIYGYGDGVFPPTDFHTATLVGEVIVMIGNLGYADQRRVGDTQVLTLDTTRWQVDVVETAGDKPGWIGRHSVTSTADRRLRIRGGDIHIGQSPRTLVENTDDWELDLHTRSWRRITDRGWQQWLIARSDAGPSALWRLRTETLANPGSASADSPLATLYTPPLECATRDAVVGEFNVHRIDVDGTIVRYVEDMGGVRMVVEGPLPSATVDTLTTDIQAKLSALDNHPYAVHRLT